MAGRGGDLIDEGVGAILAGVSGISLLRAGGCRDDGKIIMRSNGKDIADVAVRTAVACVGGVASCVQVGGVTTARY